AALREAAVHLSAELLAHPPGRAARRTGAERVPLDHDDVGLAPLGEVVGDACPDDAPADDDRVRSLFHAVLPGGSASPTPVAHHIAVGVGGGAPWSANRRVLKEPIDPLLVMDERLRHRVVV